MKYEVSYHQVDHSDALNDFVEQRCEKLASFGHENMRFKWVISASGDEFKVSVNMSEGKFNAHFDEMDKDVFKLVENIYEKVYRSIRKRKNMLREKRQKSTIFK